MSDAAAGSGGHWGFTPDSPGWWWAVRGNQTTPRPVEVEQQAGRSSKLCGRVPDGPLMPFSEWRFYSVKIADPAPPDVTPTMRKETADFLRFSRGIQRRSFIETHEPIGELLLRDLVEAGLAREIEGRIEAM